MEISFNDEDFQRKMKNIVNNAMPEAVEKGLGVAVLQLLNDCIMEVPTVPIKEGWLRGSGSAFAQNKLVAISKHGKPGKANQDHSEHISYGNYVGVVGFNVPYASRLHEGIDMNFTDPSSGAKYLESKLIRNKDTYFKIIANRIKESQ